MQDTTQNTSTPTLLEKPLLSPKEFRTLGLGGAVGRNTVYELIHANRIKHIKLGRKILIPASEIRDFPAREADLN